MTVDAWLAMAVADVERRKLPELVPLLEGLAHATRTLRRAGFNDDPTGQSPEPWQTSGRRDS